MVRQAMIGMTIGAGLMVFFGAGWMLLGIYAGRILPVWLRIAVLLIGLALSLWTGFTAKWAVQLRADASTSTQTNRQIGRRFGWISGLEGGAIALAVVLLNVIHRPDAISFRWLLCLAGQFITLLEL